MKTYILFFIGAILLIQCIDAFPRPHLRIRRSALRIRRGIPESKESEELTEKDKLLAVCIGELIGLANFTVESFQHLFDGVVAKVNKKYPHNPLVLHEVRNLSDFSQEVEAIRGKSGEEYIDKLFDLFGQTQDLTYKYELDSEVDLTDVEKKIRDIMDQEGLVEVNLRFVVYFQLMSLRFTNHIEEYINSLNREERKEEYKMIRWFSKLQNEHDYEKRVDILMQFFDLYS